MNQGNTFDITEDNIKDENDANENDRGNEDNNSELPQRPETSGEVESASPAGLINVSSRGKH